MNVKRYLLAALCLFVFIFLYEWFVHGYLLTGMYQETSRVWRSYAQMTANFPLAICFKVAFAAWIAFIFTQLYKKGGVSNGLYFGLYFGVFAGILTSSWYLHLPVPAALGWGWFFASVIEGLGSGLVVGWIYRK